MKIKKQNFNTQQGRLHSVLLKLTPILLLFWMSVLVHANEWEKAKESDGISISYRWHTFGNERYREMKVEFLAEASPELFIPYLKESQRYKWWAPGVNECESLVSENGWIMYTQLQTLWPFGRQDMVADFRLRQNADGITITVNSSPEQFKKTENVSRLHPFNGSWVLSRTGANETLVTYKILSKTKPKIPRYLQDPIVQYEFIKGIRMLRNYVESDSRSQKAML